MPNDKPVTTVDYQKVLNALYYPIRDDATWEGMQKKCVLAIEAFERLVQPPVDNAHVQLGCQPFGVANE